MIGSRMERLVCPMLLSEESSARERAACYHNDDENKTERRKLAEWIAWIEFLCECLEFCNDGWMIY